ncbi:MAG: protein jag [Oscillospiraceae bacterium]|nr:protein jag [Oscillospiraceae bacterium]
MRSSEKWGVDVDTAVDLALKELKISREDAEIEVLEESSNGFLGIGSKLARVRVTAREAEPASTKKSSFDDLDAILAGLPENSALKLPDEVRADYDKFEAEEREDAKAREKARSKDKSRKSKKKYSLSLEDTMLYEVKKLEPAKDHPLEAFLRDIATQMGVDLDFSVKASDELVFVEITGKDTGTIIGKRGSTLDAVQCLASYVVNKDSDKYIRVILDAENYRAKREKTLVNLANRLAGKVERSGRPTTLEPMNPYERKVIHCTLQNHPSVKTRSEGKDPYRKVIIENK